MRAEVYAHERAHDDPDAAVARCLAYCDAAGWKRPHPMVTRRDDPVSPDLGSVLMADKLGALVVPHVGDLLYAGVDAARLKAGRRLTFAEERLAAVAEARDATQQLLERGIVLCFADADLRVSGEEAERLAGMLDAFVDSLKAWDEEERRERSVKGREAVEKGRARGKRIGRPPKNRDS